MKQLEVSQPLRMFALWIAVSAALVGLDHAGWVRGMRGIAEAVLLPFERAVFQASDVVRSPFQTLRFWRSGTARIADLERQVAELTVDATRVMQLEEENAAMRKLLGAPLPPQWRFIPAPLVGRGEEIFLGVGTREGVLVGDVVVWGDVLVGTILQTSTRQSSVRLLTDPRSSLPVYLPSSGADGLLEGRFGSQMVLTQVLQSANLREDALVVTSGAFGPPRGLVVGKVREILTNETDVYQEAVVEPVVDFSYFITVFVVKEQ
ncbi:rod shape-determining protein MreC [Patescibacteria group bacterium]|nr:rod shape-determining protein MreC [Patescibacteria group bacterium]